MSVQGVVDAMVRANAAGLEPIVAKPMFYGGLRGVTVCFRTLADLEAHLRATWADDHYHGVSTPDEVEVRMPDGTMFRVRRKVIVPMPAPPFRSFA